MEHHGRIHAILSGLLADEIKPQQKGGNAVANPTIRKEMAANHYRLIDLSESDKKITITVFMDRLSKMVHFAPCTKWNINGKMHLALHKSYV